MKTLPLLRSTIVIVAMFFAGAVAPAQFVTIDFTAGVLHDTSDAPLANGRLVLLVADTAQDGFGTFLAGSSLELGGLLDADDQILGITTVLNNGQGKAIGSFTDIPLGTAPYTALTPGDSLALVWFSTLTGGSSELAAGDTYGLFAGELPADGPDAWEVPAGGSTITINFKTLAVSGGTHAESDAYATGAVSAIPEPSPCAALAGLCALGLAWMRRRRAAA